MDVGGYAPRCRRRALLYVHDSAHLKPSIGYQTFFGLSSEWEEGTRASGGVRRILVSPQRMLAA